MDGGLKQRLVGALVLVALAVLFIPILLDNQRDEAPLSSRIPQEPALGEVREISLDLEQAHQQVVKEQQALVARIPSNNTPADQAPAEAQTAMPEVVAEPEPGTAEPVPDASAVEPPSQQPAADVDVAAKPVPAAEGTQPAIAAQTQPETNGPSAKPAQGSGDAIGAFLRSAWVVQAGVFGSEANAKALTAKLKSAGFKAFTRKTPEGTRVFIGPELDRSKAVAMAPRVEIITKVKPRVVPFDPMQH
ncbi:MAG: SPOR domain-containing protein [Gammaproteobacteria bacterium]|nr:SPOR domain-containing protein [Gammaproteobacteria bacterium]